jgi:hypothetical protein
MGQARSVLLACVLIQLFSVLLFNITYD